LMETKLKMKKTILIFASLALMLGLAACDVSLAGDMTPPPGSSISAQPTEVPAEISMPAGIDPEAGAEIYVEKCVDCHGPQGLGDGSMAGSLGVPIPPIGVLEQAVLESPQEWFTVIRDGRMSLMMPPFSGSLNDQQIWDVLGYVYALGTDPELAAEGEAIYGETCAACHGENGEGGASPGAPSHLDPERMTALSIAEIMDKVATGSGNDDHIFGNVLDSEQQSAVALYVRSLLFGTMEIDQAGEEEQEAVEEPVPTEQTEDEAAGEETSEETGATEEPAATEEVVEESEAAAGVITGQVVNGSGGAIPEGLEVSLQGYTQFELVLDLTAPVAEDGSFRFEDVTMNPDDIFIAVVEYEDMFYPSDFYVTSGDDGEVSFEVVIYDTTTDTSNLVVYRTHVFFEWLSSDRVQVVHLVTISNLGSETVYTPGETEPVLAFSLPEGATNLVFESGVIGDPYVSTETGFGDPRPVAPGEGSYEILYAYEMEYDKGLTWSQPIELPTDFFAVFVEGEQVDLSSDQMEAETSQMVENGIYQTMVATDLAAGDEITMEISGKVKLDDSGSSPADETNIFVIVAGVLGLGLAGFGVWQYFRSGQDDAVYLDDLDTDALVDEIVDLDEAFKAGEIDEAEYRSQRAELKGLLRERMEAE
jgi:mono/diheme cytochrome c family protein